jgi:hypothetical protein
MIDGKEHWQQEESDVPQIPMPIRSDILKNNQTYRFCEDAESILSRDTCCSGCSKIPDAYPICEI